jgi:phosphatidylglycerophosphate synthase
MTRYWFKPRRYGYGATPATWEGWLVTILAAAIMACSIAIMNMNLWVDRTNFSAWIIWAVLIATLVYCFVQICRRRTDGEWQWRWGESSTKSDA